jgi:hypothetical protein
VAGYSGCEASLREELNTDIERRKTDRQGNKDKKINQNRKRGNDKERKNKRKM